MTSAVARSLLEQQGRQVCLVPCTVTQVSPLLVSILGADNVPAVKLPTVVYSLGSANALVAAKGASTPIVLPIG